MKEIYFFAWPIHCFKSPIVTKYLQMLNVFEKGIIFMLYK